MTEKTEASQSSNKPGELDLEELRALDSQHVTLAQAIEQAQVAVETCTQIEGRITDEIDRFRVAVAKDLKPQRLSPDRLRDVFGFLGLGSIASGIAVAFHWSYSLIAIGVILLTLSVIPLLRSRVNA